MTDYLDQRTDLNDPNIASVFDELSFWSARFGAMLFKHLDLVRNIDILDLACGTGFPLFELAHLHGSSCRVIGLDPWKAGVERAAVKLRTYGLTNVGLIRGDGCHLPFPKAHFDLIVSNLGINNFADAPAVLAECARVARPRARLALTTNVKGHMQQFYDVYRQTLAELGKTRYLDRLAANESHRGTRESIPRVVEAAGFRITKEIEDHFHIRFLDGSALFRHWLVQLGFLEGWRAVVDPEDEPEAFSALERNLNRLAQERGELNMRIPMLYVEARRT